nr:PREDICTED: transmembrane protein 59-like [Anolis carolinensis]|eukprot:XP_008123844.1 PREDICTED: transmembrane protein 59-like [Anolis carolinensis]
MAAGPAAALVLFAAALAAPAASAAPPEDPFAAQLGDLSACRERCGRSLRGPGAPPGQGQDAVLNACSRGCRLFSICHFVDATVELNATRAECESACMEAYLGGEEQFGCLTGCRTQMPVTQSLEGKAQDQKPPAPFSVLDVVSNFCNDIVSSAQSFISSTWTFYLQADDGKVVVFQSQPEMEYPVPEVQAPKLEVSEEEAAWTPSAANTLKPHTGLREKLERPPVEEDQEPGPASCGQPCAARTRFPGMHVQAFGAPALDPGRLPLPLGRGHALAQLRQPGHRPRSPRQDTAPEHQRGQGVPGGPGRARAVLAAPGHRGGHLPGRRRP